MTSKSDATPHAWGSDDQYYAARPFGRDGRGEAQADRSGVQKRVAELLTELHPDLRERVARSFKQWNLILRDYLRNETGLRLSVGDDRQGVRVLVVDGLPAPFADAIEQSLDDLWLLMHRPIVDQTNHGLEIISPRLEDLVRQQAVGDGRPSTDEYARVSAFVHDLADRAKKLAVLERLKGIEKDVLGAYFFRYPEIHLYWMAIGVMAATMAVAPEALTLVTACHELAHAYSHLGRDIDGNRWDTESFAKADAQIVEGIAQFYTGVICRKLAARFPQALAAFDALLEHQSGPYAVHQEWAKEHPAAGEVVRVSMIECRSQNTTNYVTFTGALERHQGVLSAKQPSRPKAIS